MKPADSAKSFTDSFKEETAHLSLESKARVLEAYRKTLEARDARVAAAAKAREAAKGKTT